MGELVLLRQSLSHIFCELLPDRPDWENIQALSLLREINAELDRVAVAPAAAQIAKAMVAYRSTGNITRFSALKYVCYGAAMRLPDGWCLLGDDRFLSELLAAAFALNKTGQRLICFQALLSAYFAFDLYDLKMSDDAQADWKVLRDWLVRQMAAFQSDVADLPVWFAVLEKHAALLTSQACEPSGKESDIGEALHYLRISDDSWVVQDRLLAQMRMAALQDDEPFKACLDDGLIKRVLGHTKLLESRAIAILLDRYARCRQKPDQPLLRDTAASVLGNPWLCKPQWDALFKQDEARLMVSGWLKRRLIADFFELFCAGTARRRLDYWLGYASKIDDIWFVLGSNTWVKEEYDFRYKAVRRRTDQSRWLQMSHETNKNNNAFVMRIGNLLVVEFSASDDDSFFFPTNPMPFNLGENQPIAESRLKCTVGKKLAHQGSWWENNFDLMLRTAL